MTAKQMLLEYVAGLTEEEAMEKIPWIVRSAPEYPPAPPEIMEKFRRAMADSDAGRTISDDEVARRFGLA